MKNLLLTILSAVLLTVGAQKSNAQEESVTARLAAIKAKNQEVIEKQQKALQKLDEMKEQAEQIKTFAKRT